MRTMMFGIILILAGCSKHPTTEVANAETAPTKVKNVDTLVADVQTHCKPYEPYQKIYGAYCYVVTNTCQESFEMLCTNYAEYCTPRTDWVPTGTVMCTTLREDGSIYTTKGDDPKEECRGSICASRQSPEWPPRDEWPDRKAK